MPAVLETFPLNDDQVEYGWTCNDCRQQRAGLTMPHALNSLAKHNRERHAEPVLNLTRAAQTVMDAWDMLQTIETDRLHGDATVVRLTRARAEFRLVLSTWEALTGLAEPEAIQFARAVSRQEVTAHVAPF